MLVPIGIGTFSKQDWYLKKCVEYISERILLKILLNLILKLFYTKNITNYE